MTHPEDLLPDYVDGSLKGQDRGLVEAHLASCSRCRDEVELARGAASALRSLPEVPAPAGLGQAAIDEAEAGVPAGGSTPSTVVSLASRRYRFLSVAAAAAVVAAIVIIVPRLGATNHLAGRTDTGASAEGNLNPVAGAQGSKSLSVEIQQTDYNATSAGKLAATAADQSRGASPPAPYSGSFGSADTQTALSCIANAFKGFTGDPLKLIRARFQGRPAYIGVYAEGPAGRPSDAVSVRVASVDGCSLITYTKVKI